jgi:hypothetical protein
MILIRSWMRRTDVDAADMFSVLDLRDGILCWVGPTTLRGTKLQRLGLPWKKERTFNKLLASEQSISPTDKLSLRV